MLTSTLHLARRRGIARALALAAVALLAVSAVGATTVFYLSQTGSPTGGTASSSAAASSSQGAPLAAATSSSSSSATTTTTSATSSSSKGFLTMTNVTSPSSTCPLNETSGLSAAGLNATAAFYGNLTKSLSAIETNATASELFANFSQMALSVEISSPLLANLSSSLSGNLSSSLLEPIVQSYTVVGQPVVGSLKYYEVNFTVGGPFPSSYLALFAPNGTATSVTSPALSFDFNGTEAAQFGPGLISPFLAELETSALAKSIATVTEFAVLNETAVSLGPNSVNVTYYGMKSLPMTYCGVTITSFVEGAGTVPGTNLPLILYTSFQDSFQGGSTSLTTKIVSLTVAP